MNVMPLARESKRKELTPEERREAISSKRRNPGLATGALHAIRSSEELYPTTLPQKQHQQNDDWNRNPDKPEQRTFT